MRGDIAIELGRRVAASVRSALGVRLNPAETLIRPSERADADYQCNIAMSLAKDLKRSPRAVADLIVAGLDFADIADSAEIAGPGFINFVLRRAWLEQETAALLADERLGVPIVTETRRFAIDYSSPNVAKEMHVGHLRSSIIGDALLRLLRFVGYEVVPHNHVGDWGTPFGMLIEHLVDTGRTADSSAHSIHDLNGFYQEAREKFETEADFAERSRLRVVLLQSGDGPTRELWQALVDESGRHFERVYRLLGIELTAGDVYGESFYNPYLATVVDELTGCGLTEVSDGAVCVFPAGFTNRDGEPLPLIVRKRDSGYGYAATDLATVRYWVGERGATDLLYLVGNPQSQHLRMVFAVARQAGYLDATPTPAAATHIGFGSILGADGKTIRTRAGKTIKLVDLLTEAVEHAASLMAERADLDADARADVARAVGIGALKYADLAKDRTKDYVFTWDKMLATEGNTSVYLQYANARAQSILGKAGDRPRPDTPIILAEPVERALALTLRRLPAAIDAATTAYAPHRLCHYLFELATTFSGFYETCPILAPSTPPEVRASRLALAEVTSKALVLGLSLLGIEAPQRL